MRAFPDNGTAVRISTHGGRIPHWSRHSKHLYYRTDDQRIMVAAYSSSDGSFVASEPREWLRPAIADTGVLSNFDLDSDGSRIIGLVPAESAGDRPSANHATFIFNFFDDLRRRVPQTIK